MLHSLRLQFTTLLTQTTENDFVLGGPQLTTTIMSPTVHYRDTMWCLEARKVAKLDSDGRVCCTISAFLRRCPVEGSAANDVPVATGFSIRALGIPGTYINNTVVGKAAEPKSFSFRDGEEKWGWHKFLEWHEDCSDMDDTTEDSKSILRFIVSLDAVASA